MSFTITDVSTAVSVRGYDTTTLAAPVLELAKACLRRLYSMRRWSWLETTVTVTATPGASLVPLGAAVDRVDAIRLSFPARAEYLELDYLPQQELADLAHIDRAAGSPMYWTLDRALDQIQLYPTPDLAYTVEADVIVAPTVPTAAGTTVPYMPDVMMDLVVLHVCAELAGRQRDWNAMQMWAAQYDARLTEILKSEGIKQRQTSGTVRRWSGWEDLGR